MKDGEFQDPIRKEKPLGESNPEYSTRITYDARARRDVEIAGGGEARREKLDPVFRDGLAFLSSLVVSPGHAICSSFNSTTDSSDRFVKQLIEISRVDYT